MATVTGGRKYDPGFLLAALASLLLVLLVLSPLLDSGYFYDDSFDSLAAGKIALAGSDMLQFTCQSIQSWAYAGRFFPLAMACHWPSYALVSSLQPYKALKLALIMADILAFAYLVWLMTGSKHASVMAILLLPAVMQVRVFYDGILAFGLLMQLIALYVFLSLIFLMWYLKSGKKAHLGLSLAWYACSLLTYEITYVFFIMHLAVAYLYGRKPGDALKAAAPFAIAAALAFCIPAAFRLLYGVPFVGGAAGGAYNPNPDLATYAYTLAKQAFAALPLSYFAVDPLHLLQGRLAGIQERLAAASAIIAGSVLVFTGVSRRANGHRIKPQGLAWTGICLWVLPGVMISLAPRYQAEIYPGVGYIPVYLSYFGVAMVALAAIVSLYNALRGRERLLIPAALALSIVISAAAVVNYHDNVIVVDSLNAYFKYPRDVVSEGIDRGLFAGVPDGSVLYVRNEYPWDQPAFYLPETGIRFQHIGSGKAARQYGGLGYPGEGPPAGTATYYLTYGAPSGTEGYAILAKVGLIDHSDDGIRRVLAESVRVYLRSPSLAGPAGSVLVGGIRSAGGSDGQATPFMAAEAPLAGADDWAIIELAGGDIDADSLFFPRMASGDEGLSLLILDGSAALGPGTGGQGWYPAEDWGGTPTRWMSNNATIIVYADQDMDATIGLEAVSYNTPRTLEVYDGDKKIEASPVMAGNFSRASLSIRLDKGLNTIRFYVPEGTERPHDDGGRAMPDARALSLAMRNIEVMA